MNEGAHILVVDDDASVCEIVHEYLTDEGFRVSTTPDGAGMREILDREPADLVILDLKLPGEDGLTLATELRRRRDIGIIMLSRKGELVDRVAGLEVGADDYVSKPFHLRELLARVRSVLRRREATAGPGSAAEGQGAAAGSGSQFSFAGWILDRETRRLVSPRAEPINLSGAEFDLLVAFLDHPKRVLSRDQLLDLARNRQANLFDRSVDVQVGRLRRKIEADPRRPALIKTVRGAGYMLAVEVERR